MRNLFHFKIRFFLHLCVNDRRSKTKLFNLILFSEFNTVIIVFSLMGKFCTSMLTVANNAFTFELFPTVSRGITIALCSTSGKVGAIIAPYIAAMVSFYFLNLWRIF